MLQNFNPRVRRPAGSRLSKGGAVGLVILSVSAAGLVLCLARLAGESPRNASIAAGNSTRAWASYFQRGRYLADARTAANLVKYLFAPEALAPGNTNLVQG